MEHWFVGIVRQYGLPIALVMFFIWRDWKRENSMMIRINKLQDEIRDILKDLVTKCTTALVENTNAMHKLAESLSTKPCLMDLKEWKIVRVDGK